MYMNGNYMFPTVKQITGNEGQVTGAENMLTRDGGAALITCPYRGKSPEILLDFGKKVTGYLYIKTKSHSSDTFIVTYGPTMDFIHLSQNIDMPLHGVYQGEYYLPCRYIRLSVVSKSLQPMDVFAEIETIMLIKSQYPCSYKGSFATGDSQLDKVWKYGAYSVELCMQKQTQSCALREIPLHMKQLAQGFKPVHSEYVMFDAPRRDRETWLGDIRTEALVAYSAFGAYDVVKSSLELFFSLQRIDGTLPGSGTTWLAFMEYNYWGAIALWEYYVHTGDRDFTERWYPGIKKLIGLMFSTCDERGFVYGDGNWMWTVPREGYNAGLQMVLYKALLCCAELMKLFFDDEDAAVITERAALIKDNINKVFWNEEKGVYDEHLRIKTSQTPVLLDVNSYAVTFGIASGEKIPRMLDYLEKHMWTGCGSATTDIYIADAELEKGLVHYPLISYVEADADPKAKIVSYMYPHNHQCWPFMVGYEAEARLVAGDIDSAIELIRQCWGQDWFDETQSFWEMVEVDKRVFNFGSMYKGPKDDCHNSAAHGWSGWVAYLMQAYILGVKPTAPGYKKTMVKPLTGALETVNGKIPTPYGIITVSIEKTPAEYKINVTHPEEIEIEINVTETELSGRTLNSTGKGF